VAENGNDDPSSCQIRQESAVPAVVDHNDEQHISIHIFLVIV
jgi:hypothetical protein